MNESVSAIPRNSGVAKRLTAEVRKKRLQLTRNKTNIGIRNEDDGAPLAEFVESEDVRRVTQAAVQNVVLTPGPGNGIDADRVLAPHAFKAIMQRASEVMRLNKGKFSPQWNCWDWALAPDLPKAEVLKCAEENCETYDDVPDAKEYYGVIRSAQRYFKWLSLRPGDRLSRTPKESAGNGAGLETFLLEQARKKNGFLAIRGAYTDETDDFLPTPTNEEPILRTAINAETTRAILAGVFNRWPVPLPAPLAEALYCGKDYTLVSVLEGSEGNSGRYGSAAPERLSLNLDDLVVFVRWKNHFRIKERWSAFHNDTLREHIQNPDLCYLEGKIQAGKVTAVPHDGVFGKGINGGFILEPQVLGVPTLMNQEELDHHRFAIERRSCRFTNNDNPFLRMTHDYEMPTANKRYGLMLCVGRESEEVGGRNFFENQMTDSVAVWKVVPR